MTARDERLTRVVAAAGLCFAERGIKAATMDEIALAAGVSKPFLYKYFESKDSLARAVIEEALDTWERLGSEAAAREAGIRDGLASRMRVAATFPAERPVLRTILGEDRTLRVTHGRSFQKARESALERTRGLLRAGIETNEFPADMDVEASARVIEILTHGLAQAFLGLHTIERSEGLVDVAVELLRQGLPAGSSATPAREE